MQTTICNFNRAAKKEQNSAVENYFPENEIVYHFAFNSKTEGEVKVVHYKIFTCIWITFM